MTGSEFKRRSLPMAFPRVFSLPPAVIGIGYLAGYVLLDWVSFIQPFAPFGITPWNPPTGLSFIVVLLFGQRYLPLLFAAPLLADLLVRQLPLPWPVELAACAVIGGGYAAGLTVLLRPATRFNPALASMRDLILLLGVAAASSAAVAVCYVGVLVAAGLLTPQVYLPAALQFWIGDVIGVAVVAPFALIVLTRGRALSVHHQRNRAADRRYSCRARIRIPLCRETSLRILLHSVPAGDLDGRPRWARVGDHRHSADTGRAYP